MSLKYNILFVDDTKDFIDATEPNIESKMAKMSVAVSFNQYSSYSDFLSKYVDVLNNEDFVKFDLILVDYNLESGSITGINVIDKIRSKDVYTDIIFYSSNYTEMKNKIKEEFGDGNLLEGIYFCDRKDLISKALKIVDKNLRKSSSAESIRGLMMNSTSNFDIIARDICKKLYDELDDNKREEVKHIIEEGINNARKKIETNFGDINRISDEKKKMYKVLDSVHYIMDNKDKYSIFQCIINAIYGQQYKFDLKNYEELISNRNKLAHQYIFICKENKRLLIVNSIKKIKEKCNKVCKECVNEYSADDINELRKSIYGYFLLFKQMKEEILESDDENI